MKFKSIILLQGMLLYSLSTHSQNSPVKLFTLKQEPTAILPDSTGSTHHYAVSFEATDSLRLTEVNFKIIGLASDSIISQRNFALPQADGIYPLNGLSNALIKDRNHLFIILGNIKSTEPLKVIAEFRDSNQTLYPNIVTNQ